MDVAARPVTVAPTYRTLAPGVLLAGAGVAIAFALHEMVPTLSVLMIALVLGAIATATRATRPECGPGLSFVMKRLLRLGVGLLGFQLAAGQVLSLGFRVLLVVVVAVVLTFASTYALATRLGLTPQRSLLIATGFSICGASAVAAMDGATDSDEEDVMTAIALVTAFGTLVMIVLPLLQTPLRLDAVTFGLWAGASVHEVGQVVATASAVGSAALAPAVVIKLTRVVLLAPLIAGVSIWGRRTPVAGDIRPATVPVFVVGFLVAMALRSTGVVPSGILRGAATAQTLLLSAAMFGMGASVCPRALLRTGAPAVLVGLVSTLLIAAAALAGLVLVR